MAKLAAYRAKRDFALTPEPDGSASAPPGQTFVVQKHAASRLHYDLRLELDGVMKSWAVAKGPSLVPGEKRLAVHVEDHPIAYNTFEGTIPKGQYGGGTVLLWDMGRWEADGDPRKGYRKGHLAFRLEGRKLHGAWHLVRMKPKPGEKNEPWLLIKSEDEAARTGEEPDILDELPRSVATGRTLDEIAADPAGDVWDSRGLVSGQKDAGREDANAPPAAPAGKARTPRKRAPAAEAEPTTDPEGATRRDLRGLTTGGRKAALPAGIEPCLAETRTVVPTGAGWLHEIKWDGYRILAFRSAGATRLQTRRGLDWTHRFPSIADVVGDLPVDSIVLDGEAVVEGENGVASFSALQAALSDESGQAARNAILHAFDLLYLNGFDLRSLPLEERKARLAALLPPGGSGTLRYGEHLDADGEAMFRGICQLGLEGLISKRRDRPYRSGRGDDWVKIKCAERQEFVILGFVPSSAAQRAIGSLVLGYHDRGKLKLAGRSGTGFSADVARALWKKLDGTRLATPALAAKPSAEERRGVVWVEPTLVAEIEFRGWTGDDRLRHAAFKGLREDKDPGEVVREPAADAGAADPAPSNGAKRSRPNARGAAAEVRLTHPDRILWESAGITKQGLAEYYEAVAGWILPQIVDRPLSLVRCPNGAEGGCFFQKHAWAGMSDHIHRRTVTDEKGEGEEILFIRDLGGLTALVQASVLEIHPWGSRIEDPECPDRIVVDLDPGEDVAFSDVVAAAREVRDRLGALKLDSFVKTTGGKGLHVVVPLSGTEGWADVKAFSKALADSMAADAPDRFVAQAARTSRRGRIYVDYLRNGRGATAVSAYSTRARPNASVSVPLDWSELSPALTPAHFTVANLPARLDRMSGDPWAELFRSRQRLPAGPGRRRKAGG